MAIRLADTARPNNYVDAEHKGTFPVAYADDIWFEDGTRLSEKTFGGDSIQKEELPLASADELGKIYQYVGETGTYTNGRFYKCIFNSSVYSWSEIKMVEKPVVYSETVPDINVYETGSIVCYTGKDSGSFEKGHLYQKNETSFTYYYWTFYRDSAKTQPYIFYTQEETLANGVKVYQANPASGEGDISLVGSITNYQEFSFFVSGSSFVQYFHPEADTSKNRTITDGNWVDIGGGSKLDNVFLVKDSEGAATLAVSQRTFTGTQAEWDALTIDEKLTYKQVNITDDESDPSVVVDAVTNGDMHAVTSNAVYDELKKVQSQTYECSGVLINSTAGEIYGYGRATVTLKDGVAEIKFSARIHANTMTSTFSWGLNRDLLRNLIPDLPVITPISTNSNLLFFAANGTALIDRMGYGAMALGENQFWVPARMYQTDGVTGAWGSEEFPVNSYITGTVYGTYTV